MIATRAAAGSMISQSFWRGKSVLVTGGSSGIGRAAAIALGAAGARVGLIARRREPLADAVAAVRSAGGVADAEAADVVDATAVRAAVADLERRLGACDVAIASAGIHRVSWPLDAAIADHVIDVNVKGCIHLAAAVLPGMLTRGRGRFCGIASLAGVVGLPGNAAYCGSKAAVIGFLEGLRLDAGPAGITITTALPVVILRSLSAITSRSDWVAFFTLDANLSIFSRRFRRRFTSFIRLLMPPIEWLLVRC
jgi:NAD(P)-dependent dehydrogenase (short-subunit alcohol dehydrogenase family)